MSISRRRVLKGAGGLAAAGMLGNAGIRTAVAQQNLPNLPTTMIWSCYDVGAAGYVEASAVADALGKRYGTRVRLLPSGSSMGRVKPVMEGRASHGWLATELYFAVEALYEFAAPDIGPQDLRTVMGRVNSLAIAVTEESGIRSLEELKGKPFAYARTNTSINAKVDPILEFAGMTIDDLQLVEFPGYGQTMKALVEGKAVAGGFAPSSAGLRELEASPRGIRWLPLDPANTEAWARVRKNVPFVEPFQESVGAGLSEQNKVWMLGYRYPMITVQASTPADQVYAVTKAVVETFDDYKSANAVAPRWAAKLAGKPPMDAALHEGAIRYLKEIGIWQTEDQQWQDAMLKRHAALQAAWKKMIAGLPNAGSLGHEQILERWMPLRAEVVASL